MTKEKTLEQHFDNLDVLFRGRRVQSWYHLPYQKPSLLEKILKIYPPLWSWFFEKVIQCHFYRGQRWIYESMRGDLERYKNGEVEQCGIDSLKAFMEKNKLNT